MPVPIQKLSAIALCLALTGALIHSFERDRVVSDCQWDKLKYEQGDPATIKEIGESGGAYREKCRQVGVIIGSF